MTLLMAAIVDTLLLFPLGALVALFCWYGLGLSPHALVTFGGTYREFTGLLAWWALLFAPACVYARIALS